MHFNILDYTDQRKKVNLSIFFAGEKYVMTIFGVLSFADQGLHIFQS